MTIEETTKKHQSSLLALPGVVSVGIGLSSDGQKAIIVGLDGKHPETEKQLPKELDGYQVVSQETGIIKAR